MLKTNKILITGGAGFIGSNMAQRLAANNDIIICDWLESGKKWQNLQSIKIHDFVLPEQLTTYLTQQKIDQIVHMGAISSTTEQDADLIINSNFVLSKQLWKYASEHSIPFIYASSAATYGDGQQGFEDQQTPEFLAQLKPLNAYGWSKYLFDRFVINELEKNRPAPPQWAGLKFFNVYGEREEHKGEQRSVISKLYSQIKAGAPSKLFKSYKEPYEDGGQLRDFVYVDDICNVMLWLLENPTVSGLYNIGAGKARSFKDLALATYSAMKIEPNIQYIEMPRAIREHYQYYTEAPMQKIRAAGYDGKQTSLEEGVKQYVQGYLSQL